MVSVGNLPAGASVIIKITYVTELDMDLGDIVFRFPATLAGQVAKKAAQKVTQTLISSELMDSDSSIIPQSFQLTFEMPFEILKMYSPSHPTAFQMKSTDTKGTIQFFPDVFSFGGVDLEFRISMMNANQPRMWIEEQLDSSHRAAMICFYPEFEFLPQLENEFLFLIDCSASMSGSGLLEVNRVMQLFLKQLPGNSYFNLIGFGSTTDSLFFTSKISSKDNLNQAKKWINELGANLGGTNVASALYQLYLRNHQNRAPRHIFLLSDGQFHDFGITLDLVQNNASNSRLFCCGIGNNVNRHNLYSLAGAGSGSSVVFSDKISMQYNDSQKVLNLLEKAVQPAISNLELSWIGDENTNSIQQAPKKILSVFHGERKVLYGMLGNEKCSQVLFSSQGADGEQISCRIGSHTAGDTHNVNDMIHKLATRALLRDYEEGVYSIDPLEDAVLKEQKKLEMVELSCKYNVVCSLTSFLAIEKRDGSISDERTPAISELISTEKYDLLDYIGWGEGMDSLNDKFNNYIQQQIKHKQDALASLNPSRKIEIPENYIADVQETSSLDILLDEIKCSINEIESEISKQDSLLDLLGESVSKCNDISSFTSELDQLLGELEVTADCTTQRTNKEFISSDIIVGTDRTRNFSHSIRCEPILCSSEKTYYEQSMKVCEDKCVLLECETIQYAEKELVQCSRSVERFEVMHHLHVDFASPREFEVL